MTREDRTRTAIVDDEYHWRDMNTVPFGKKVQLLNLGGVAVYGSVTLKSVGDWLGWAPLPTRNKDDGR